MQRYGGQQLHKAFLGLCKREKEGRFTLFSLPSILGYPPLTPEVTLVDNVATFELFQVKKRVVSFNR